MPFSFDPIDQALARKFDREDAEDVAAGVAAEALKDREFAIIDALVKPGSQVDTLLNDETCSTEYMADLDSIVRMAADPLTDPARIGVQMKRIVAAAIGRAAQAVA